MSVIWFSHKEGTRSRGDFLPGRDGDAAGRRIARKMSLILGDTVGINRRNPFIAS